jgi:hypothetical protein
MTQQKIGVWRYGVFCIGVKNRCRKIDRHHTDKNEIGSSAIKPSEQDAIKYAKEWAALNMKSIIKLTATLTYWEQDGQIETWAMFNDAHNIKYQIV